MGSFRIVFILLLCTIIMTFMFYWIEIRPAGVSLFSFDQSLATELGSKINRVGKDSKLQLIISGDYLVGAVAFLGFLFSKRYQKIYAILALVPLVTGLLKMSKMDMLEPIVTYAVIGYFTYWSKKNFSLSKIFQILLVTAVVISMSFGYLVNLRNMRTFGQTTLDYSRLIGFRLNTGSSVIDEAMAFYYGYACLNLLILIEH